MERDKKSTNIELRSEEVQELMGKISPIIQRIGISIVLVFVILIYIASNVIMYPDIVSVPIIANNVNYVSEIKTESSGILIESKISHDNVCNGDTLAKIVSDNADGQDTVFIISPCSGIVYPCDIVKQFSYVESGSVLCIVSDSINDKIRAKAFITAEMKNKILKDMVVESIIEGNVIVGKVVSVADYADPYKGTYAMSMEFETPLGLVNTIFWHSQAIAKIKITERSVFDKFFKERIIPTIKYKM